MRGHRGALYVADVGQLVVIDVASATITQTVNLDAIGAVFPNDVAVDADTGDVYVTDAGRNAIYRLAAGALTPEVFVESPALESPNGILVGTQYLTVAATGAGDSGSGRVLLVDRATKAVQPYAEETQMMGALDGIEPYVSSVLVTDHAGGRLLRVQRHGRATEVAAGLPGQPIWGSRSGNAWPLCRNCMKARFSS